VVDYGEPCIRHHVILLDEITEWKTAVSPEFEDLHIESRGALLKHQVEILRAMKETIKLHDGCENDGLIADIVSKGALEEGTEYTSNVWEDSLLLGELFSESDNESAIDDDEKCTGTVDFFNDTGGYGFIETDAYEDDVFYHMEDVGGPDITEGEELRFSINQAEKGPRAEDVERVV